MVMDNKSINDGDVFTLGEVQLEFTF